MSETFYWAIGLLATCWLTALLIVRFAYPIVDKYLKRQKALTTQAVANTGAPMAALFTSLFNKNYKYRNTKSLAFNITRFWELLKQEFPNAEIQTQMCNIYGSEQSPSWCTAIISIAPNIDFLLQYNFDKYSTKDYQGRASVKFKDDTNIENFLEDGGFNVSQSIEYMYSDEMGEFIASRITALQEICATSSITYETGERKVRMYRIRSHNGEYTPAPYDMAIPKATGEYLNLAYCSPEIEFAGEVHKLPMADVLSIMTATLQAGENIQIYGSAGTGKSKLLDQICSELVSSSKETICVVLAPSIFTELRNAEAQASFIEALQDLKTRTNGRIVFVIDEAESLLEESKTGVHTVNQSFLLRLMAGDIQTLLGCSTVLAYNAEPSKLNSKIFRKGRTSMLVKLLPISGDQGAKLVQYLKGRLIEKSFDEKSFVRTIGEKNVLPNGDIYANPGEITLADVYAAFVDRDKAALIVDKIRAAKGLPPLRKVVIEKKPISVVVEQIEVPAAASPSPVTATKKHKQRKRSRKR